MKLIIANWKAHKTSTETITWMETFNSLIHTNPPLIQKLEQQEIVVVICPSLPFFPFLAPHNLIKRGAQTVSDKPEGSFTGEVTATQLEGLCEYVLVGHSERREYYHETNEMVVNKTKECLQHNLQPIVCIRSKDDEIPSGASIIAYEPQEAIGSGQNAPVEEVLKMKKSLNLPESFLFLYGGSVDDTNAKDYVQNSEIDGLLIGSASLDAENFYRIIENL